MPRMRSIQRAGTHVLQRNLPSGLRVGQQGIRCERGGQLVGQCGDPTCF